MLKGLMASLLFCVWAAPGFGQEDLYENFNRTDMTNFPPYGWRQIDANGDGAAWLVASDGVDHTTAVTSYIKLLFNSYKPDNWLVTPRLVVEDDQDSLSYWAYSSGANYMEVWVSRTGPDVASFTTRIDSLIFDGSVTSMTRSLPLQEFIGDTVYVAFRHLYKPELPGIDNTICLAIDNVSGPRIVQPSVEISVEQILVSGGVSEPCDITDSPVEVLLVNKGAKAVDGFDIACQSVGLDADTLASYSEIIKERVDQRIEPGDTLRYTFESALPFSTYLNGLRSQVYVRAFIGLETDEYEVNDTLVYDFYKQNSFELPMEASFEVGDPGSRYWYLDDRLESQFSLPFGTGQNPQMAHAGNAYLFMGVYSPWSGPASNGEDAFAATRCLLLEEGMDYRIDMFYGFRKLPEHWDNQGVHFRVILGKDQANLLDAPHTVVLDTFLRKTGELIMPGEAHYSLFSSSSFSVEETGTYYMGLVFYSDSLVEERTDEWMIFIDDFALRGSEQVLPVDLNLERMVVPYDCNLTDAEAISFVIRNTSVKPVTGVEAAYCINGGDTVREIIADTLYPDQPFVYEFKELVDFSKFGRYRVDGTIAHPLDSSLTNNGKTAVAENSEVAALPYEDDFENYGTTLVFEDEWRSVYSSGYYSWMAAFDYSADTSFAWNGVGFLADASDNEHYVGQDDWIASRCFAFVKDSTYEISFAYRIEKEGEGAASLHSYILASYDTASKVMDVAHLEDIQNTDYLIHKMEFTAEEDFIGHLALQSKGEVEAPILMLDAFYVGSPRVPSANEDMLEALELQVWPNPVRDELHVRFASGGDMASVAIYTMSGKKLMEKRDCGSECELSVSGYETGMYLLLVTDRQGRTHAEKLLIGF